MFNISALQPHSLQSLVENQTTFTLENAALHLFETHVEANLVALQFGNPVLASMIQGRKVMHLRERPGFNFLPGESIMLPDDELMVIDFPDAQKGSPTKCLALEVAPEEIRKITNQMNEHRPLCGNSSWQRGNANFHFTNDPGITQLIQRLVFLCAEDHPSKDIFVGMSLRELLIRLLEAEAKEQHLLDPASRATSNPIAATINYILNHLDEKLTVVKLSRLAYMSESAFYRSFKNEMGMSPVDFINGERIKLACNLLKKGTHTIQDISLRCGFNSASYFSRMFKRKFGVCPASYQEKKVG